MQMGNDKRSKDQKITIVYVKIYVCVYVCLERAQFFFLANSCFSGNNLR